MPCLLPPQGSLIAKRVLPASGAIEYLLAPPALPKPPTAAQQQELSTSTAGVCRRPVQVSWGHGVWMEHLEQLVALL